MRSQISYIDIRSEKFKKLVNCENGYYFLKPDAKLPQDIENGIYCYVYGETSDEPVRIILMRDAYAAPATVQ